MNYLKTIKTAKQAFESESEYLAKKQAACEIIELFAKEMYDAELDCTQYCLWEAIQKIIISVKYRY